jgi:putative hydrolase of the HAD superfamily
MPSLQNIILDYGNVIIDIDQDRTEKAFNYLFHNKEYLNLKDEFWQSYETGQISSDEFIYQIKSLSPNQVSRQQIIDAWNALLLSIPVYRLNHLEELSKTHRLFLLSNTNEIHICWTTNYLDAMHGISDFEERFFEKVYYSHLIHLRKPDKVIFDFVLQDSSINPSETIFIDDTEGHLSEASLLGIHTHCLKRGEEFLDVINNFIS